MRVDDMALAEKLSLRRARVATVMGILFITSMASSFNVDPMAGRPEAVQLAAWIVWAAALLFLITIGGGLLRGNKVRGLMNDDSTRDNRRSALEVGFWAMVACAFTTYIVSLFEPITGREAIRLILTVGVGAATISFGTLERRALKGE
jgi:hypothetical protein